MKKKLLGLDINKACSPDQMYPHLLKETANELCKPLSIIMNKSLFINYLPKEWKKKQCISALLKKEITK